MWKSVSTMRRNAIVWFKFKLRIDRFRRTTNNWITIAANLVIHSCIVGTFTYCYLLINIFSLPYFLIYYIIFMYLLLQKSKKKLKI